MNWNDIKQAAVVLIITTLLIISASFITGFFNKQSQPIETPKIIIGCPSDYSSYTKLATDPKHIVSLIDKRTPMFAKDGKFINAKVVVTKSDTATSKVKCGYLFVQVGTDRGGLLPQWEDAVVRPSDFGGHLVQDAAIWVNNGALYSQYLYSLDKIQYWDSHYRKVVNSADWTQLLNVSENIPFLIALNTLNHTGFVDQVSIVYKCYDPDTGEENTGCSLHATEPQYQQTENPVQ